MGSRGQKKKRLTGSNQDIIVCQRRGLLESHGLSESHKQAYKKYLTFTEQMRRETAIKDGKIFVLIERINTLVSFLDDTNVLDNIKQET
jgi:hypothetical protein